MARTPSADDRRSQYQRERVTIQDRINRHTQVRRPQEKRCQGCFRDATLMCVSLHAGAPAVAMELRNWLLRIALWIPLGTCPGADRRPCDSPAAGRRRQDAARSDLWVWIGLEDDSLFETCTSRGVEVLQEPENHSWAYEMKLADIDGNVLWLGTGPTADLPLVGKSQ